MNTNREQMKGIYLTPEGKAELEAKVAELEHKNSVIGGITYKEILNLYKKILSSATILPVEESWERLEENLLEGLHEHTKLQNVIHIDYPQGVIIQSRLIQTTTEKT